MCKGVVFFVICVFCIFMIELLFMKYDGKYLCVYNLINGDRVVGVVYNLDDDVEFCWFEFIVVFVDYDKV